MTPQDVEVSIMSTAEPKPQQFQSTIQIQMELHIQLTIPICNVLWLIVLLHAYGIEIVLSLKEETTQVL